MYWSYIEVLIDITLRFNLCRKMSAVCSEENK